MPKQGEIGYARAIGRAAMHDAYEKPFSDDDCGAALMELGAMLYLLPAPPGKLLDLGCGTGWTSCFFARRGYDVVGQDICADMIEYAYQNKARYQVENLEFVTCDYEQMGFDNEFDCAVFYDSLHHSVSEEDALRMVYKALKPGGICVTSEPGMGHAHRPHSQVAMELFNVTERDMPPGRIIRAGRKAGFRRWRVYPHMKPLSACLFGVSKQSFFHKLRWLPSFLRVLPLPFLASFYKHMSGIVVLEK